jgi:hypothetical protein
MVGNKLCSSPVWIFEWDFSLNPHLLDGPEIMLNPSLSYNPRDHLVRLNDIAAGIGLCIVLLAFVAIF